MRTDWELVQAWRDGDREVAGELITRHFAALCRFFRAKLGDGADDLVQRTLLACVQGKDRLADPGSFRAYMFAVARRQLCEHLRSKHRERPIDPQEVTAHDLDPSPSRRIAERQEQQLLLSALRRIPLDLQIAIELHYWEGLTSDEIGVVIDVPSGTVRSRLRRARELLRQALTDMNPDPSALESTLSGLDEWARSLRAIDGDDG